MSGFAKPTESSSSKEPARPKPSRTRSLAPSPVPRSESPTKPSTRPPSRSSTNIPPATPKKPVRRSTIGQGSGIPILKGSSSSPFKSFKPTASTAAVTSTTAAAQPLPGTSPESLISDSGLLASLARNSKSRTPSITSKDDLDRSRNILEASRNSIMSSDSPSQTHDGLSQAPGTINPPPENTLEGNGDGSTLPSGDTPEPPALNPAPEPPVVHDEPGAQSEVGAESPATQEQEPSKDNKEDEKVEGEKPDGPEEKKEEKKEEDKEEKKEEDKEEGERKSEETGEDTTKEGQVGNDKPEGAEGHSEVAQDVDAVTQKATDSGDDTASNKGPGADTNGESVLDKNDVETQSTSNTGLKPKNDELPKSPLVGAETLPNPLRGDENSQSPPIAQNQSGQDSQQASVDAPQDPPKQAQANANDSNPQPPTRISTDATLAPGGLKGGNTLLSAIAETLSEGGDERSPGVAPEEGQKSLIGEPKHDVVSDVASAVPPSDISKLAEQDTIATSPPGIQGAPLENPNEDSNLDEAGSGEGQSDKDADAIKTVDENPVGLAAPGATDAGASEPISEVNKEANKTVTSQGALKVSEDPAGQREIPTKGEEAAPEPHVPASDDKQTSSTEATTGPIGPSNDTFELGTEPIGALPETPGQTNSATEPKKIPADTKHTQPRGLEDVNLETPPLVKDAVDPTELGATSANLASTGEFPSVATNGDKAIPVVEVFEAPDYALQDSPALESLPAPQTNDHNISRNDTVDDKDREIMSQSRNEDEKKTETGTAKVTGTLSNVKPNDQNGNSEETERASPRQSIAELTPKPPINGADDSDTKHGTLPPSVPTNVKAKSTESNDDAAGSGPKKPQSFDFDPGAIMKKIPGPNPQLGQHLNKPDTDVGEINAIWNTWFNFYALLSPSTLVVEPAAHRYDLYDRLLPDIVFYPLPTGQPSLSAGSSSEPTNKWQFVYYGNPGVDDLSPMPGSGDSNTQGTGSSPAPAASVVPPSSEKWQSAVDMVQYICENQNQKPVWAILAIGCWVRFYIFIDGKITLPAFFNIGYLGGACIPLSLPKQPDPEETTQSFISVNLGDPAQKLLFTIGIPMIFTVYSILPNPLPDLPSPLKEALEKIINALPA